MKWGRNAGGATGDAVPSTALAGACAVFSSTSVERRQPTQSGITTSRNRVTGEDTASELSHEFLRANEHDRNVAGTAEVDG
jgi:hypothetical protein